MFHFAMVAVAWTSVMMGACSVAFDVEELANELCDAGYKACNNECVDINSPAFGCNATSCVPCAPPEAVATCDSRGNCAIASCVGDNQDCDGNAVNGCEIDLAHDPEHCGSCIADPCEVENGRPGCGNGICSISSCNDGFDDCNEVVSDGCERPLGTDTDCAECNDACSATGTSCVDGMCQ